MIQSASALASALSGTSLANRPIIDLPILDTGECAYALEIRREEVESAWREARSLLDSTGRWPLVVTCWGGSRPAKGWADTLHAEDLFMRFPYEQCTRSSAQGASPAAILRAADSVDVPAFLAALEARRERAWPLANALAHELENTRHHCGSAPTQDELDAARVDGRSISSVRDLDRWLLQWERHKGPPRDPNLGRQPWFDPGIASLLFMPVSSSWDSLAYIHWWGMYQGAERYIALGRQWSRRFGAELVAHYGTMLQCLVSSPPQTIEDAWELGREHDLAAPCTLALPGILLRHYAIGLVGCDRWFLHERP